MSLNRVVVVGRITKTPELKYTPAGAPVVSFSVAVDRFTKDDAGKYETDFFNVTAWRKTAEFVNQYLPKGRLISIDGRLQQHQWVDQATGMKRSAVEIVADNVDPVGPKPASEEEDHSDQPPVRPTAPAAPDGEEEESDPFQDS
jgi:single-strand DNA-binding protein